MKKNYRAKENIVLIGVGANIGDSKRRFYKLFHYLQKEKSLTILATSIILKNPPFGYLEQADFYNTLLLIETKQSPMELLKKLQRVENHFGRKRLFDNAPRTLDLDIILYNKQHIKKDPVLIVPHPHFRERQSVMVPLSYLKGVKWFKRVL